MDATDHGVSARRVSGDDPASTARRSRRREGGACASQFARCSAYLSRRAARGVLSAASAAKVGPSRGKGGRHGKHGEPSRVGASAQALSAQSRFTRQFAQSATRELPNGCSPHVVNIYPPSDPAEPTLAPKSPNGCPALAPKSPNSVPNLPKLQTNPSDGHTTAVRPSAPPPVQRCASKSGVAQSSEGLQVVGAGAARGRRRWVSWPCV